MKINKHKIWINIEPILFGIILALFIKTFFIQAYIIPSASMMNTLLVGDCLIANKLAYNFKLPFMDKPIINISTPKRHDIVIFKYPKNPKINYIKRVIGLPGEIINIRDNKTFINNVQIESKYAIFKKTIYPIPYKNFGPIKVPENHLFVMGDNRNNSSDSRDWGFVNINQVKGKAVIIYWSWDNEKKLPRLSRLITLLSKKE